MLRYLALALLLLGTATSSAFAQRKLDERRAAVPAGFIRIFAHSGSVQVRGWEKDSVAVTGTVTDTNDDRFIVEMTPRGAKIGLMGEAPAKPQPSVVTIMVPQRSQVWIKTGSADIAVTLAGGSVNLFSITGSIVVSGSPQSVYAETMSGEINLSNIRSRQARVKTASGVITTSGAIGDLTAVTVSGDINSVLQSFVRARIESVDGNIRYYGAIAPASVMDVINHSGGITLVIPASTSAEFAFSLYEADLTDEFAIKKRWMMSKQKEKEMSFGVGDRPTARVTIRSFKGPVAIRRQPVK